MQKRDTKAEPRNDGGVSLILGKNQRLRRSLRASSIGLFAILLMAMTPGKVSAVFLYEWLTTRAHGSTLQASFVAPDAAISNGMIQASSISSPPGFKASTPAGVFTNLLPGSALAVDPVTGQVLASGNSLTAANPTYTLLMSDSGYSISNSLPQVYGSGIWRVSYVAGSSPQPRLTFLGFASGQPQLLVTRTVDGTVVIEVSADLGSWQPLVTNQIVSGVSLVTDPTPATTGSRFYRAVIGQ